MKKVITIIILMVWTLLFICNSVYATSITLEQIVEKFNKSSIVDEYKSAGGNIKATKDSDGINVTINANGETENIKLLFQENVLSIEIDQAESTALAKMYVTLSIIDIIGELHGYQEGELLQTISSEESQNYTLEKEGYEVENISTTKVKMKVDITKKIPLVDVSDNYLKVSDLEGFEKYISGDGFAENSKGDIWFYKSGYDGKYTVYVAEKENLTENTYKSVLSILEVMFENDKVIQYFKNNYSNISEGDKEFKGFNIKVNPTEKTEHEESMIPSSSNYEFVRIDIDKTLAISSATEKVENENSDKNNQIQVEDTEKDNTALKGELPKTGSFMNFIIIAIICIAIIEIIIHIKLKHLNFK